MVVRITLNSREEEDKLLFVDIGVKSPNHVNLCSLLCGLIYLFVDRTLPHTRSQQIGIRALWWYAIDRQIGLDLNFGFAEPIAKGVLDKDPEFLRNLIRPVMFGNCLDLDS